MCFVLAVGSLWSLGSMGLASSTGAVASIGPETINCVRDSNCLLLPVTLNGHTCLMLFDTGAENISISRAALSSLDISLPTSGVGGAIQGVGTRLSTLRSAATVKVGNHTREDFPVNIQEQSSIHPIIGSNFFQDCSITVDVSHSIIVLNKHALEPNVNESVAKNHGEGKVELLSSGNQLLIPVTVNGRSISMLLDSGADGITFSKEQAAAMNLLVPANAKPEVHMGVAGAVSGVGFTVGELAVGSLVKQNVKVSVIESPGMPYPLMGADFLKDCSYTIDKKHSQITFERI
jgi:clan AA aspartic protease (TIGR02281 family)